MNSVTAYLIIQCTAISVIIPPLMFSLSLRSSALNIITGNLFSIIIPLAVFDR